MESLFGLDGVASSTLVKRSAQLFLAERIVIGKYYAAWLCRRCTRP